MMKRFLINVLAFLALLVVVNMVLLWAGEKLYFKDYTEYSSQFKSFLLADSHGVPLEGFTEKFGVYNFAEGSDSYFDIYRKIRFLINNSNVDTIYITADDHTLSPYRENMNNLDRSVAFAIPEDYDNYYQYFKKRYLQRYIVFFQPKTRAVISRYIRSKFFRLLGNNELVEQDLSDANWEDFHLEQRIAFSKARKEDQFLYEYRSEKLMQALLDIIAICKQNNITLIGLKFPLTQEYVEVIENHSYGADSVLRSNGCIVKDFKKLYVSRGNYFFNQDHLNRQGGKEFVNYMFSRD